MICWAIKKADQDLTLGRAGSPALFTLSVAWQLVPFDLLCFALLLSVGLSGAEC